MLAHFAPSAAGRGSQPDPAKLGRLRAEAHAELMDILESFRRPAPKVADVVGFAIGGTLGGGASLTALYFGGSVAGLSDAGITSRLATSGALLGGGMVAGVGVLAAPIAACGLLGFGIARGRRNAKLMTALREMIDELRGIEERLIQQAEHLRDELAENWAYRRYFEAQLR